MALFSCWLFAFSLSSHAIAQARARPTSQCARRTRPVMALATGVRAEAVVIGREEYLDRFTKALVLAE